ncbi:MAG: YceI family protein [Cyclobacteriaceae bacterium]
MKPIQLYAIFFTFLFAFTLNGWAQTTYRIAEESKMVIKGTSTLHDWESKVTELEGEAQIEMKGQQPHFQQVTLTVPVKSIKSEYEAMDTNTFNALQEEEYPTIQFTLNEIESISEKEIKATGDLTVAGNTQPIAVSVEYEMTAPDQISLKGSHALKMTDFGIEPPTAVFGTIETSDEITVDYTLQLSAAN